MRVAIEFVAVDAKLIVMPLSSESHNVQLSVGPEPIRVCVRAADHELRTWLIEELSLMTWIGALELTTLARFTACDGDLVIVGLEQLDAGELDLIRSRATSPSLIVIGSLPADVPLGCVDRRFDARVTSRELKQAIRELLAK